MTDDIKYKHLCKTENLFLKHGWIDMEAFVYKKDNYLQIFWSYEQSPCLITNKDVLNIFDKLNEDTYGDELKQKLYNECIQLLKKQKEECYEYAQQKGKENKKIYKIRCIRSDGTLVSGRSEYDYKMCELFGMFDEDVFKDCKRIVDEWRRSDTNNWHVLNENERIIY